MHQTLTHDPIDALTLQFGDRLQHLCARHKDFLLTCLAYQRLHPLPMEEIIDTLDWQAFMPDDLTDAIVALEPVPRERLLALMEAIVAQLRSEAS